MFSNQPTASANLGKSDESLFWENNNRTAEEQGSTFNQYSVNNLLTPVEVRLIEAVERGDTTALRKLMEKKIDVCDLIQLDAFKCKRLFEDVFKKQPVTATL